MASQNVRTLIDSANPQARQDPALLVVVGARITDEARHGLGDAGVSWLDLRGQLHLAAPGLLIHTDVTPMVGSPRRARAFSGQVGIEVAATMLIQPHVPVRVRQLAQRLNRAPSSVSAVITALRDAGLIDANNLPQTPELFWELAAAWEPETLDVSRLPVDDATVDDALQINSTDTAESGWALSDSHAAAVYGAPVAIRAEAPPDFYVPDTRILRRAAKLLGPVTHGRADRAATLRVAPIGYICSNRVTPADNSTRAHEPWPLAHPLFVALDLAQDPGRGREVLGLWTPQEETAHRVW
ncbi:transcriptional regulator [Nocardia speluncae]|uniref:Transcriptional regulator n=1 Tax=Nocardia speluncae TaxID=419477 RepID=A0A846XDP7_9NOCA|nr:transcriptional regulator [Nocardia speluncae]NKY34208.1 transcriptional regulator [Nocardia speluncae]